MMMRGAFRNSGSNDIGRDPLWVNGVYMGKSIPRESEAAALESIKAEGGDVSDMMNRMYGKGIPPPPDKITIETERFSASSNPRSSI
jgi:hypothetical protein